MSGKGVTTKPCPSWCTGTHDLITPGGECIHASSPVTLMVGDEPMRVYIETYVACCAQEPPPGQITWDFSGTAPSMTAQEAESFVAILGGLINLLAKAKIGRAHV